MRRPVPRPCAGTLALAGTVLAATVLAVAATGCLSKDEPGTAGRPGAAGRGVRGIVLISLDTLRADRLGAYGYARPTSPFLDSLAARGTLFEHAYAPYPSTLVAHASLFTGLSPDEHGVRPPSGVLPSDAPTVPELLSAAGFRTSGHTEGGFVAGGFGFARGFERFTDTAYEQDADLERTLSRGLDFLETLEPGARFFLFLHSYSVHDPYDPPRGVERFDPAPPPAPDSSGERLRRHNDGSAPLPTAVVARMSDRYDASVRYADEQLESFFAEADALGAWDDSVLVVTSDHGEEFLEHERVGHTQAYPENLRVPLLLVDFRRAGGADAVPGTRVREPVDLADLAPTLLELARVEPPARLAGRSLLGARPERSMAIGLAESEELATRSIVARVDGTLYQLLESSPPDEAEGIWLPPVLSFDSVSERLSFRARSYRQARTLTASIEGEALAHFELTPAWSDFELTIPGGGSGDRVTELQFEVDGCSVPAEVEGGTDERCLSGVVQGLHLGRWALFDLEADPLAATDLAPVRVGVVRHLARRLAETRGERRESRTRELPAEEAETLRALGYLD